MQRACWRTAGLAAGHADRAEIMLAILACIIQMSGVNKCLRTSMTLTVFRHSVCKFLHGFLMLSILFMMLDSYCTGTFEND